MSAFYFFISSGRWAHFQAAAKEYAAKHNGENYFTALNQVSSLCHLKAVEFFHCCLVINKSKPKFISWVCNPCPGNYQQVLFLGEMIICTQTNKWVFIVCN